MHSIRDILVDRDYRLLSIVSELPGINREQDCFQWGLVSELPGINPEQDCFQWGLS